ncbi:MAG: 50S ribosomal protein L29 [Sandaracinaceae bacterium]|nr:50S ribosomal protein L29 [Sandaracinaceae bacterium]
MKAAELREKAIEELFELERSVRKELWEARLRNALHELDDTSQIRRLRRTIARIKTIIAEKKRNSAKGE